MAVPITALYGAIHAVFNVALAANVTRTRAKHQVFLGSDNPEVQLAVRRHGNHAEYTPFAVLLLLLAELNGGGATALHVLGVTLTLGRVLHVLGVGPTPTAPRALGAVLTWLSIAAAGIYALVASLR